MAHYAFLDENNIVTDVITGIDETETIEGLSPEEWYGNFRGQVCKRTSRHTLGGVHLSRGTPFRKNYAAIGTTYDSVRDAFIPVKPFESWVLNEDTCLWEIPNQKPDSGMWMVEGETWEEQQYDPSNMNIVCGYPRSGNTYLNHYVSLAYGDGEFKGNWHTEDKVRNSTDKVLVSIRNPLDCIASWANYQLTLFNFDLTEVTEASIEDDINYYLRFMQAVLDKKDNLIIFDFDQFTTDLSYADGLISEVGLTKLASVSDEEVKAAMVENNRQRNLPQNTDLSAIKTMVQNNPKYADCVAIYNAVKG